MQHINTTLATIAAHQHVTILYACETGSRAWGFPSPDSDYDIRFIYRHAPEWYLQLGLPKDSIEIMDGELDINGWDLRKSLRLLMKLNAALIERFTSPIVYYAQPDFMHSFQSLIPSYYAPVSVFYHHFSLARKFWEEIKDASDIKLKAYFYLIRSLLTCNWVIQSTDVPPMHIEGLMTKMDDETNQFLRKLIALKATVGERYLHHKDEVMQKIAERLFEKVEPYKNRLKGHHQDYQLLDDFFIKTLYANDHP